TISKSYTSSSTWPSVARDGSLIWCKPASPKQVWRLPVLNILCAPLSNTPLCTAHGAEVADGVSDYDKALEVSGTCPGLWIAVATETWSLIGAWSVGDMAKWLVGLAGGANLRRYRKVTTIRERAWKASRRPAAMDAAAGRESRVVSDYEPR
ncbi:MAG: hypothetical protein K8U57_08415, partial [Planctomycetes bacterium]|nr:hypothetical protein [Planctomycetota bacterium]